MKILYASPQPIDSSLSAAVNTASARIVLTSATRLDDAARWIFSNLDVAALILDSDFGMPHCASFLRNLRSRGLSAPLILMASEEAGWTEALSLSADDRILQKDVFLNDFEGAVMRVVCRARPSAAFAILAGQVVEMHRLLDRFDEEHDLRIEVGDLRAAHTELQEQLTRSETALDQLSTRHTEATDNAARREEQLLGELREETERRTVIASLLQGEQRARREADDSLKEERLIATERIAQLGEREARLVADLANTTTIKDALVRQIAEHQAARKSLEHEVESKNELLEQLGQRECEVRTLLADTTKSRDALDRELQNERSAAVETGRQIRQLHSQLEDILRRLDQEFDNYPLPLCRASRTGAITHANRAFGALLGCPSADTKRRLSLASELFDSSNEYAWLVERCVSSGDVSSVEFTRRKVDGSRLMLRLRAMPGPEAVHIVVEDLTANWMLQERLHRAQQMEAVGRMAAEVALTCVGFLRDVTKQGCRLIAMLEDGTEARRSSEHIVGEVDRVAMSLRQLADYADDEAMSLDPVDLHQVLHDLEPVLQELAGDDVEIVLPERPPREIPPFNLDVTTQRVERLLVNLARFSRERIASGQMVFDVAPTTVDGQFLSKYPNVRPGPHVLLTVKQAKGDDRLIDAPRGQEPNGGHDAEPSVFGASGVQLSALHGLVRHCGGHLWMDTDTTGEIIKIHLPLRAA
jgi:PAS domain-containing protein